ncbi:MAG: formate dehydrogenase accessory sulfurtransferase FdhD [Promethearchaeota archaeon]|nr:MAG: formate dehydrogenase accessory sulfurtransferase FdhD [Candidatus Lokiarchaeota archaeon]
MFKKSITISKVIQNKIVEVKDEVLIEKPIDININSESFASILCLPKNLKELTIGFLFSTGVISSIVDILQINLNEEKDKIEVKLDDSIKITPEILSLNPLGRVVDITSGISTPLRNIITRTLGSEKKFAISKNKIRLTANSISNFIKRMQSETKLFQETGGCHGCAIFDKNGNLITIMEDIGRHNAIDKAIGEVLLKKISFDNLILCSTGRLTGDSVLKAIRAKIPIVASVSAPIESGINLAKNYGITLIGFVREKRMNIYTHSFRIEL